ncbi:MAG: hypothetical protein QM690_22660 [Sphingobium sp.]
MSSNPPPSDPETRRRGPGNPIGPGAPIALLVIAGVIIGGLLGQPSIGLLVGLGLGILVAVISWRK